MAIIVSILYQELLVEIISSNRAQVFPPDLTLCLFFNPFDCHKNITRSSAHYYFLQFIGITVKQIQTNLAQTSISTCRSYSVKQLIITWAISLRGQLLLLISSLECSHVVESFSESPGKDS